MLGFFWKTRVFSNPGIKQWWESGSDDLLPAGSTFGTFFHRIRPVTTNIFYIYKYSLCHFELRSDPDPVCCRMSRIRIKKHFRILTTVIKDISLHFVPLIFYLILTFKFEHYGSVFYTVMWIQFGQKPDPGLCALNEERF